MGKLFHGGKHSGDSSRGLRPDDAGPGPETYSWSAPYWHALDAMARYPYGNCSGTQGGAGCSVRTWAAVSPEEEAEQPLEGTALADHAIATLRNITAEREQQRSSPQNLSRVCQRSHMR